MAYLDLDVNYIQEEVIQTLATQTNITYLSPGSKARLLLDIVNDKLQMQAQQFDDNIGMPFIRNASGVFLDYIGEIFGIQRSLKTRAEVAKEEKNFYFYTGATSFGDINNGQDIIIPSGSVKVFNTSDPNERQIVYTNSERIILPRNENIIYFSAHAIGYGTDFNVGANTLIYHNFKNYADTLSQSLLVNNDSSITYGSDDESDENYRFKIQQQSLAGEAANFTSIRLALLSVAGIADVVRIKFARGIGTADWLVKAVTPEVPQRLLDLAQQAINSKQAEGMDNKAIAPVTIGLQLFFSLTYRERLEDKIKDLIKIKIKKELIDYVNNLAIGQSLIQDQLVKIILKSDDRILSMGSPNSAINFDRINTYKRSALSTTKQKKTIINDYIAKDGERIIMEPSLIDPIIIVDNN